MKKFSIILNIVLVLVTSFFIVFSNIQTNLSNEQIQKVKALEQEAVTLAELAEQEAALAKESQAKADIAKAMAEKTLEQLMDCQNSK